MKHRKAGKPSKRGPIQRVVSRGAKRPVHSIILSGLRDCRTSTGYRGRVLCLENGKWKIVAFVYGDTLKEMRARKHAMTKAVQP